MGDEGGFAPNLKSNEEAIQIILQSIEAAGFRAGHDIYLGLDVASSEFYREGAYHLESENKKLSATQLVEIYKAWVKQYPIISIEDGMSENDWSGWDALTVQFGKDVQLVGDDLFVTNTRILQSGIEKNVANSILVKVNQIGTLTETFAAIAMAANVSVRVPKHSPPSLWHKRRATPPSAPS